MVLALMAGTFLSSGLSAVSQFVIDEFALTKSQFGALATAFTLGSAITAPVAGRLADRIGGRRMLVFHFAACSLGILAAAQSSSYIWLLAAVGFFGLISSGSNPGANRLIATSFPPRERGPLMGVKATGQPLMVTASGLVLPSAAAAWGWRGAMTTGVAICAAGLLLTRRAPRDRPHQRSSRSTGPKPPLPASIKWLTLNGLAMGAGTAAVLAFLPLFAQERLDMSVSLSGLLLATVGLTSVAGRLMWGRQANSGAHVSVALNWLTGLSVGATISLALSPLIGQWAAWIAAGVAGLSMAAWNAVGMTAIVLEVDTTIAGAMSGVVMAGFLCGWMITPPLFGFIVDSSDSYTLAWLMVGVVFALALVPTILWRRGLAEVAA
jgi:MFS transporter, ACS family, hexuronate transporter